MTTESQINANRQNAQHSTGPRTEAGKSASSRNHLTLGLYTRQDYVKPDERDLYKHFCETMHDELAPQTLLQESLVSEVTGATWRLRRCGNVEGELADYAPCDPMLDEKTDKTRRSLERARASAHSILHRSMNQLRKLKKDQTPPRQREADPLDQILSGIMNCPEPDWDALDLDLDGHAAEAASHDLELASNCEGHPAEPASDDTQPETHDELASNCAPTTTPALVSALIKRNLPCACGSRIVYRECCGKNEPRDWKKAA